MNPPGEHSGQAGGVQVPGQARCLNHEESAFEFSVCTLVTNNGAYQEMVDSFVRAGFTCENSEFLYLDNSRGNFQDGYNGMNTFLTAAKGKYIILCHQDILLKFDQIEVLRQRIRTLDEIDPNWAVLGNAGYGDFATPLSCITDPWGENRRSGSLPAAAQSLDENFLLLKHEANLALSHDLHGFHLYATDLCRIAAILGWKSYVIDFHLYHKSGGYGGKQLQAIKKEFIEKYSKQAKAFAIRTVCTQMIITGSRWLNYLLNRNLFYSLKYRIDRVAKQRAILRRGRS